jgi:hypothetical protein
MTQRDIYQMLINAVFGLGLMAVLIIGACTAGYYSEIYKQDVRPDKCINAACDGTCNKHRFVRHQGCEK